MCVCVCVCECVYEINASFSVIMYIIVMTVGTG